MEKIEIKKLVNVEEQVLDKITNWMYNWWGKEYNYGFDELKCLMQHSMQSDKLPQTYGVFLNDEIIGMYQFVYDDLDSRPDLYPWLANVYIDKKYRKKGYGRKLLESIRITASQNINFDEIFLYTEHIGLYEKYGWVFVEDVDTFTEEPRIKRLYKLKLK